MSGKLSVGRNSPRIKGENRWGRAKKTAEEMKRGMWLTAGLRGGILGYFEGA